MARSAPDGLFVDYEFGSDLASLCVSTEKSELNPKFSNVEWLRPSELLESNIPRLDLSNLSQTELGCCGNSWLLSSVLVAMDMPYGLTTIFEQQEIVKEGCYSFVFKFGGQEASIVIDDRIPCLEGSPMYGGFAAGFNIAFMLLEKALAKLVGSYEALASGSASDAFRASPIGRALFEVCKPPDFVEDEELTEQIQEVCKNACIMMLESTCTMYGDHSDTNALMEITEFFTNEGSPEGVGIVHDGNKHIWAAEPKRVLPGSGSCACQDPVVTLKIHVKSRVRVEMGDAQSAANVRIYQTAPAGEPWTFVWRHAVPGSATEFDLLLEPCMYPYILFFTQMSTESTETSKPCFFNIWSDKEIGIEFDNDGDLELDTMKL